MSISVIDAKSYEVLHRFERMPRTAVCTDGGAAELPPEFADFAHAIYPHVPMDFRRLQPPEGADELIWWRRGDQWLTGSVQLAFSQLLRAPGIYLVPVHLPALPDLDLVGLEPRWTSAQLPRSIFLDRVARIRPQIPDSEDRLARITAALLAADMPPTRITSALYQESVHPGSGIDELLREAGQTGNAPVFRALSLRNAIAIHARDGRMPEAQRLLKIGLELFPDYAEFHFVSALFQVYCGQSAEAVGRLIQAASMSQGAYIGSGGENSYRAHWLLAELASRVGKQGVAFHRAMAGVRRQPTFEPALAVLLKQRVSTQTLRIVQWELAALARREPRYFRPLFDYFLLHRMTGTAQRMLSTTVLNDDERIRCEQRLTFLLEGRRQREHQHLPHCLLQGAFLVNSSAALINRKLGAALVQSSSVFGALDPFGYGLESSAAYPEHTALMEGLYRLSSRPDCTIRNHWPHDFTRPEHGRLATIIPWEFTGVPKEWVRGIRQHVDELWVPSRFTQNAFVEGGIDRTRIRVIPNGVDPAVFSPEGPRSRPEGARSFIFLFVGGLIKRKGVDLLVRAYCRAFRAQDDVTLVLKDLGSSNFYQHITLLPEIEHMAARTDVPHILVLKEERTEAEVAALYRGSNALVLPYRGEGFGLPIAEAMACGVPVITTGAGPAPEFCRPEESCLVPALTSTVPRELWPAQELTAPLQWFEPDEDALVEAMREVYERSATWQERARDASRRIRTTHAWNAVTSQYLERLQALTGSTPEPIPHQTHDRAEYGTSGTV